MVYCQQRNSRILDSPNKLFLSESRRNVRNLRVDWAISSSSDCRVVLRDCRFGTIDF